MEKKRINADVLFGMFTLLISIYFIVAGSKFPGASNDGVPGAGYFPIFAAVFVAIFSVALIIDGIIKQNAYFEKSERKEKNLGQLLMVFGAFIIFFILWHFLPFVVAALVFELMLCKIMKCSWKFSILYSVIIVAVIYLIFSVAFKVNLNL